MPRKPCSYGAARSQSDLILLPPRFSLDPAPSSLSRKLLRRIHACLPELSFESHQSIGSMLSPVHFPRQKPQQVSCYAFFKCWLLLSLHPRCLRFSTKFVTLSIHFRTLTLDSVVPVSEQYLTHCPPFLFYAVDRFRVGRGSVPFRACEPYPYFTPPTN